MKFIYKNIKQKKDIEDASWAYYSKNPIIKEAYLSRIRNALKLCPSRRGQNILEIGVGCGIALPSLAKYGKVSGIDYNLESVEKSKRLCDHFGFNCNLVHTDLFSAKFPKESFDTIITLSVLEHIKDSRKALKKIRQMIKKDGTLIIGLPIERFLVKTLFSIVGIKEEVNHLHVTDYKTIEKQLKEFFSIKKIKKIPHNLIPDTFSLYILYKCKPRLD